MRAAISLFALWLAMILSGCAAPTRHATDPLAHVGADRADVPFSMRLSIKASTTIDGASETGRVTGTMWGNGTGPVRMDLSMGIGTTVARCLEDGSALYVYVPREDNLYVSTGTSHGGPMLSGFRLPFGLREIALLAHGCFTPLTDGPRRGRMSETPDGLPSQWSDRHGWTIGFSYRDGPRPYRMTAMHRDGSEAVIIVKRLERVAPYAPAQLRLDVPAGTTIK